MDLERLLGYAKIAGPILSTISIAIGVAVFLVNSRRDRAKKTLEFWESINQQLKEEKREIRNDYGDCISGEKAKSILESAEEATKINRVINIYERLALGVNISAYDIKVLNRLVGQNIINNYERFQEYILLRRVSLNRPFAWQEFETLVKRLKKLRGGN